jgi:hypothetical protein
MQATHVRIVVEVRSLAGSLTAHDSRETESIGRETTAERRSLGNIPATRTALVRQGAPPKELFLSDVYTLSSNLTPATRRLIFYCLLVDRLRGRQEGAIIASEVDMRERRIGWGCDVAAGRRVVGGVLTRTGLSKTISGGQGAVERGDGKEEREREKKLSTTSLAWLTKKDQGIRFDVNRMRCKKNPEASLYRPKTTA